ncbi:MAG: hypothetical protein ACOCRX_07595 [Candidatus Woesearchaeota archaeon]
MSKKGRTKAQERYDKRNPVISFRVDDELKEKLDAIKEAEDKSYRDLILDLVEEREADLKTAFKNCFEEAIQNFLIMYTAAPEYSEKEAKYIREKSGYQVKPNTSIFRFLDEDLYKTQDSEDLFRIFDHFLGIMHKDYPPTFGKKNYEDALPTWEQMKNYEPSFRWENSAFFEKNNE